MYKKYGEEKGYVIWLERQNKWKQSLYDIGYWVYKDKTQKNAFQTYKEKVWSFTKLQPLSSLPNFEKRGQCIESSYHLDHIMSIWDGFELGIEPKIIGNIVNLRFIPARENLSKHKESHYSKEQLLKLYEEYHGRK